MTIVNNKQSNISVQPILADLQQHVQAHYAGRLAGLVLFGSYARGDAVIGSDVDVLVVLQGTEQPQDRAFASDLTYKLLQHYDILLSLRHTTLDRYLHEQSPLMINIRREGRLLSNSMLQQQRHAAMQQPPRKATGITPEQAALIHRATDDLKSIQLLFTQGFYNVAASRAYYVMFSVAQAFLLSKGLSFSKHSAVIAAFGKHMAHPRIVPVEFHRYLIDAQEMRLIADYAPEANLAQADVATIIAHAEAFIASANQILGHPDP
jgi:uncharacterized protein (UPF0332 family)/predicted nucleotidyltransferase